MCGVCGLLYSKTDRVFEKEAIVCDMMKRLVHRGPDDSGMLSGNGFSLGHLRLAIIDPVNAVQPMTTPDGRYSLVFNGEIYNYKELRGELVASGLVFRTASDTEVLLQLLVKYGVKALDRLNGMFAFAFVDSETNDWIIARDHFGIKPLYYAELKNEVVFASEIKALLVHPDISASSNWKAMQHYLTFQFCLHGETLYEGIKALEPGHYLKGRANRIDANVCYWDMNYHIDDHLSEDQFLDKLRWLLDDSAKLQIRSDVPLGAYLSGGLDSCAVAGLAAGRLQGAMPVFHGRFSESLLYDESEYAKAACHAIGGEFHEVIPSAQEFVDLMPKLIYALDEPVAGPGVFPQFVVSRLAAEHVKVVLGGQGGDEIFGGYARYLVGYLEQALKGAIFETQEEGQHIVNLASIIPNLPVLQQYKPMMQGFWRDGLFDSMDARYFRLIDRSPDIKSILDDDAVNRYNADEVFADFQKVFHHPDTQSYINKMTHFDQKSLLPALLQVEDRVSMAVSLESRVPLLDVRIVDLVTSMPPAVKFKGGQTKYIFRKAVKDIVPAVVSERKDKMGFPVPLSEWMKKGPVRDFVYDTFSSSACRQRGLWDNNAITKIIDGERAYGRELWGILCLELWHRTFID